jgi:hypothetical protein
MPLYYRGAGVGTYWHERDARIEGFSPWRPSGDTSTNYLIQHIVRGTVVSPFVSLTRSYGVAHSYAVLPLLHTELEALVRVLRDAEVLVVGAIPQHCVRQRIPVW